MVLDTRIQVLLLLGGVVARLVVRSGAVGDVGVTVWADGEVVRPSPSPPPPSALVRPRRAAAPPQLGSPASSRHEGRSPLRHAARCRSDPPPPSPNRHVGRRHSPTPVGRHAGRAAVRGGARGMGRGRGRPWARDPTPPPRRSSLAVVHPLAQALICYTMPRTAPVSASLPMTHGACSPPHPPTRARQICRRAAAAAAAGPVWPPPHGRARGRHRRRRGVGATRARLVHSVCPLAHPLPSPPLPHPPGCSTFPPTPPLLPRLLQPPHPDSSNPPPRLLDLPCDAFISPPPRPQFSLPFPSPKKSRNSRRAARGCDDGARGMSGARHADGAASRGRRRRPPPTGAARGRPAAPCRPRARAADARGGAETRQSARALAAVRGNAGGEWRAGSPTPSIGQRQPAAQTTLATAPRGRAHCLTARLSSIRSGTSS